jgi:glycosyltransferase involved in cell wall biosynthesis
MDPNETPRLGTVCLVATNGDGLVADSARTATGFMRQGWTVHILSCGSDSEGPAVPGAFAHNLKDCSLPLTCLAPNGTPGCGPGVYQSNLIRYGVEALHRQHHFDVIVFPSWQAAGFRCVQAKRAGAAFLDTRLIVRLDRLNLWQREAERRLCSPDDVFLDFCERYTLENADGQIAASADLLDYIQGQGSATPDAPPMAAGILAVTVAVTHYNLGQFLPETLASLAAQTCTDMEVMVIDDGSTCADSLRVWNEQKRLYPQFRFINQTNVGLGAARNCALAEAKGEFFIPVDADNIAAPGMVEGFLRGMRARPDVSAMTCFFAAFENTDDIARGQFLHQYCPTAGPHFAACAFNVYGDANAIFRTEHLRSVGGFVADRSTYCHDWETFVKLVQAGRRIGVVPDYLFYYRRRADGMAAVMTEKGANTYAFNQRMITSFAAGNEAGTNIEARMLWEAVASYFLQNDPSKAVRPRSLYGAARRLAGVGKRVWKRAFSRRTPS